MTTITLHMHDGSEVIVNPANIAYISALRSTAGPMAEIQFTSSEVTLRVQGTLAEIKERVDRALRVATRTR